LNEAVSTIMLAGLELVSSTTTSLPSRIPTPQANAASTSLTEITTPARSTSTATLFMGSS
jgi:hypothetical protein